MRPELDLPSFNELEAAAHCVINVLKMMPEFADAKIVVIGGLGIWKYLGKYRTTKDVDFLITVHGAPKQVKDRLLAMANTPFQQDAQVFTYKAPNGKLVQIDICPGWQSPYVPSSAMLIASIQPGFLPYISELDLLAFKVNSCGLRPTIDKQTRDARDARALAILMAARGPIILSEQQKAAVLQSLDDVVKRTNWDLATWKATLNLE
ncbi:uncharacterized protein BDV17DRAFT_290990 [Aspergillus undulatus]|uniref:uncharacterized protein n=1 Tax=Aspergillus undulatus TaxID=1810928 RepID=UPI003CCDFCEC